MIIGITGGIGSGKSTVLKLLSDKYDFEIFEADKIGHEVMKKGGLAYDDIVALFGRDVLDKEEEIDRVRLSDIVFTDRDRLESLNAIVHPAVIDEIKTRIHNSMKTSGKDRFVIEAALLIESGCYKICDSVWYIYAEEKVRIQRLIQSREMSVDKIKEVMGNQLKKEEFEDKCSAVIDNSKTMEDTDRQIQKLLEF